MFFHISFYSNKRLQCRKEREREAGQRENEQILLSEYKLKERKPFFWLLLLLSRFSHVRLCVTPQTAAHQGPPSLGFSRQEHQSGCRFLLQCMKVKSESEVAQLCLTPSDPMNCSLPVSSIHRIVQARVLEWVAIAFSVLWLLCVKHRIKH